MTKRVAPILILFLFVSCAPKNIHTPLGRALYTADQVIGSLGIFQDAAIGAHSQGTLSESTTRIIVNFVKSSVTVISASPEGWRPTVSVALDELKRNLPEADAKKYETYIKLLQSMIASL